MPTVARDFQLFVDTQLDALGDRLPSGVPSQVAELRHALDMFDKSRTASDADARLSATGKRDAAATVAAAAKTAIGQWAEKHVGGLDRQLASLRQRLLSQTTAAEPNPARVQHLMTTLASIDPLEASTIYLGADPADQVVLERASATLGNRPLRNAKGEWTWQPLLDPDTVARVVLARAEATQPELAAEVRDLSRLRAAYHGLSRQAAQLVDASVSSDRAGTAHGA